MRLRYILTAAAIAGVLGVAGPAATAVPAQRQASQSAATSYRQAVTDGMATGPSASSTATRPSSTSPRVTYVAMTLDRPRSTSCGHGMVVAASIGMASPVG